MSKYKITLKDLCSWTWLESKALVRYYFNIRCEDCFKIPPEYKLKFYDNFWNKYLDNWTDGSKWWGAPYHPEFLNQWYDSDQIKLVMEGVQFSATIKPKYFKEVDTIIPVAIGLMRTNQAWQYGIFSFTAKLPRGTHLWPALWLSGAKNWPPEIDLLEGYSDNTVDYHNNKTLQSNFHIKDENGEHIFTGTRSHRVPNRVTQEFVTYVIWWEKDFIKLYYNGFLVRHITDPKVLNKMDEAMNLIIGTGTQKEFNKDNIFPMIVKEVKVYQK